MVEALQTSSWPMVFLAGVEAREEEMEEKWCWLSGCDVRVVDGDDPPPLAASRSHLHPLEVAAS